MKILIFCALHEEAVPIVKSFGLKRSHENKREFHGFFKAQDIRLVVTGMGRKNTQKSCAVYLISPFPDFVFSCGYAGGLSRDLYAGDIVLSEELMVWEKGPLMHSPKRIFLKSQWPGLEGRLKGLDLRIHIGPSLTTPKVIDRAEEKEKMGKQFHALSVDMEAGFIAEVTAHHGIPFFNLRVISDSSREDVKIDFSPWLTKEGKVRSWPVLMEIFKHPSKIPYLWKIALSAKKSSSRLAQVLKKLMVLILSQEPLQRPEVRF